MFRKILPGIILVMSVILDTAVLPFISFFSRTYLPFLTLCSVIALALILGRTKGMLCGLAGGLLLDCSVMTHFGICTVLFTAFGILIGWAGRKSKWRLVVSLIGALLAAAIYEVVMFVLQYLGNGITELRQLLTALARIGINTILTQIFYLLYSAMIKPDVSRYRMR